MAEDREERGVTAQRLAIGTATLPLHRPTPDPFLQTYSFAYAPHPPPLRHPSRARPSPSPPSPDPLHSFLTSPYRRISRVEQMIFQQRTHSPQEDQDTLANSHVLKPQFKIKTRKYDWQTHNRSDCHAHTRTRYDCARPLPAEPTLHLATLSLDWKAEQPAERTAMASSGFQETLKNRMRLTRKSPKKAKETSLLEMLNRISEGTPLHRYKSRAFDSAHRVPPFPSPSP